MAEGPRLPDPLQPVVPKAHRRQKLSFFVTLLVTNEPISPRGALWLSHSFIVSFGNDQG